MEKYLDTPKHKKLLNRAWWAKHKRRVYWIVGTLAVLLLIWIIWHKPMARMWHNLLATNPSTQQAKKINISTATPASTIGGGSDSSTGTGSTSTTGNDKSTIAHDATTTTTTTTTSTPTTPTPDPGTPGTTATVDTGLLNLAANAHVGLGEDQLISLAGSNPTSCTEVSITLLLKQDICTWALNGKSVIVTLQNGTVVGTPIKIGL